MGEDRLKPYWNNDMNALLETYKQFEVLIPSKTGKGSAHNGEDGRYVENMLKNYMKKYLPKDLEILTGFILRPAVATGGKNRRARCHDVDEHSTQLDLIVYDTTHYPVFQRIDDNVVVPPEGVIAIISLKKNLYKKDIYEEVGKLRQACNLCKIYDNKGLVKKPFTALVSMETDIKKVKEVFNDIEKDYNDNLTNDIYGSSKKYVPAKTYDEMIGYIGSIRNWTIYKKNNKVKKEAVYGYFIHKSDNIGVGFQYLIKRIFDTYYHRNKLAEPGFVSLSNINDYKIGMIQYYQETL